MLVLACPLALAQSGAPVAVKVMPERVELGPGKCASFYPITVDAAGFKVRGMRSYELSLSNESEFELDTGRIWVCHRPGTAPAATSITVRDAAIGAQATAIYRIIGYTGPDPMATTSEPLQADPPPEHRSATGAELPPLSIQSALDARGHWWRPPSLNLNATLDAQGHWWHPAPLEIPAAIDAKGQWQSPQSRPN